MQCDICQGGLESIYLQKKESPELENERPRWSFHLLEGEYKFWGWMWEMSQGSGGGAGLHTFTLNAARPHLIYKLLYTAGRATHGTKDHRANRALCVPPMHFGSNYHRQVDDENLTSFELMHDLYQFRMSFTLAIPSRAARRCAARLKIWHPFSWKIANWHVTSPAAWNNIYTTPSIKGSPATIYHIPCVMLSLTELRKKP